MDFTTWRQDSRTFSAQSVREFYDAELSETCVFLFETSALALPLHGGSFSLKLVLSGQEDYVIGRRRIGVRPGDLLLVNDGEEYASQIGRRSRSCSLFFTKPDVRAAVASLAPIADCIPDPQSRESADVEVPQIRFRASTKNWAQVTELVRRLERGEYDCADESAHELLVGSLRQLHAIAPPDRLRHLRRPATRDELIARVVRAREYIDDMQGERCSLDRLADIACLSKFHFLRIFREVFGVTPAACARARRWSFRSAGISVARN